MKPVTEIVGVDEHRLEEYVRETGLRLVAGAEIELDFSCVRRIGPRAVQELEMLAHAAEEEACIIVLRGVNIDLYKALRLLDLTRRFAFRNEEQVL